MAIFGVKMAIFGVKMGAQRPGDLFQAFLQKMACDP